MCTTFICICCIWWWHPLDFITRLLKHLMVVENDSKNMVIFFKCSIFVRFSQFCVKVWKISWNLFGSVCKQGLYMSFVNIPVDGPCVRLALLFIPACVFFFVCLFCLPLFGSSVASWGSVNLAVSSSSWERRFLYSYERYLLIFLLFFVLALSRYWCWRHLTVRVRSKPFSNARCVMIEKPWTLHQYKLG